MFDSISLDEAIDIYDNEDFISYIIKIDDNFYVEETEGYDTDENYRCEMVMWNRKARKGIGVGRIEKDFNSKFEEFKSLNSETGEQILRKFFDNTKNIQYVV